MRIALLGSLSNRFLMTESEPSREEAIAGEAAVAILRAALATEGSTVAIRPTMAPLLAAAALDLSPLVAAEERERSHALSINVIRPYQPLEGFDEGDEVFEPFLALVRAIGGGAPIDLRDALREADLIFLLGQAPTELPIEPRERPGKVVYFRSLLSGREAESELEERLASYGRVWPGESFVRQPEGAEDPFGRAAGESIEPFMAFGIMAEAALHELQPDRSGE